MANKKFVEWSLLFWAIPETFLEDNVQKYLVSQGLIDLDSLASFDRLAKKQKDALRFAKKFKGLDPLQRILLIAPEALNDVSIRFLNKFGVLSDNEAKVLRLSVHAVGALGRGGIPASMVEVRKRAERLFGVGMVEDAIATLRALGAVSAEDARRLRAVSVFSRGGLAAVDDLRKAKVLIDILAIIKNKSVTNSFVEAAKLVQLINPRTANALAEAIRYTGAEWTVFEGARKAEGLAARMGYVISGSFSHEAVDLAKALGVLPEKYEKYMKVAVQMSQAYNRRLMEQLTERRYRVLPGEAPIRTFARASKLSEGDITRLLTQAARDASKEAAKLGGLRGRQYAIQARELHVAIRTMWEGVGYITIANETAVAEAALEASEVLGRVYSKNFDEGTQRMLKYQARSNIDAFISRQENKIQLSRRVYNNIDLATGRIEKRISLSILAGKSSSEIANDIRGFISPTTPGGQSYAARRLARTELANAFHQTTIRHNREMPWVQGFKWNKSSSHKGTDICDKYATDVHSNKFDAGVFPKADVPGKPHPQCLCYLTVVGPSEEVFIRNFKRGYYNGYIKEKEVALLRSDPTGHESFVHSTGRSAGRIGAQVAISSALGYLK